MARKGKKPKPKYLHLVEDTFRPERHGPEAEAREKIDKSSRRLGKPEMPATFDGELRRTWERYIGQTPWLDRAKEPAAIAFCELWAEFLESPASFASPKHTQLRSYMNELGLTDERNRTLSETESDDDDF